MADQASREDALQRHTMGSTPDCTPAVMLMTESRAELNAGLVIVTGHAQVPTSDVDMGHSDESPNQDAPSDLPPEQAAQRTMGATADDDADPRVHKSRRLVTPANGKSPAEWLIALSNSREEFLATSAMPYSPSEALLGGLLLTPLLGCYARTPLEWTHAWVVNGQIKSLLGVEWPRHGHGEYL